MWHSFRLRFPFLGEGKNHRGLAPRSPMEMVQLPMKTDGFGCQKTASEESHQMLYFLRLTIKNTKIFTLELYTTDKSSKSSHRRSINELYATICDNIHAVCNVAWKSRPSASRSVVCSSMWMIGRSRLTLLDCELLRQRLNFCPKDATSCTFR